MAMIAPSLLSADISCLQDAVKIAEEGGADLLHIDIMDGHFVPNLTFGPQLVSAVKAMTSIPLDVHLMVDNPRDIVPLFIESGADWISIHQEASSHLHQDLIHIKESGCKAGLVLNPATPIHLMQDIIKIVDYILIMSVNPGWGGQKFIDFCHAKIRQLKSWINGQKLDVPIEVDGGIKLENAASIIQDGADILVSGSGIYGSDNPVSVIQRMKAMKSGESSL